MVLTGGPRKVTPWISVELVENYRHHLWLFWHELEHFGVGQGQWDKDLRITLTSNYIPQLQKDKWVGSSGLSYCLSLSRTTPSCLVRSLSFTGENERIGGVE